MENRSDSSAKTFIKNHNYVPDIGSKNIPENGQGSSSSQKKVKNPRISHKKYIFEDRTWD